MTESLNQIRDRVRYEINRIIRGDLDDVERALNRDDKRRALSDLDDAVTKLKRLMNSI